MLYLSNYLLSKLESAKNSLFQSVNEVLAVKSAKETMRLRSQSEKFGTGRRHVKLYDGRLLLTHTNTYICE